MVTGGIEGVGDALTGGMIARQFEPGAGEAHEDGHGGVCLNCGAALTGPYCHQCGQPGHVHRSLAAFWHDLAHGVLHFEGKIWRTLPLLAWRSGALTRRYIEGERARFVSPMALFLFSVFLMFAVFNFVGGPFTTGEWNGQGLASTPITIEQKIERTQSERTKAAAVGQSTASLDLTAQALRDQMARENAEKATAGEAKGAADDGEGWFERAYRHAKENPQLLAYKVQTNAYKFSWMLIPISVPFVWILFLHRRRYRAFKAYDHTVFVTYSLSFMTLLLVALSLLHALFLPTNLAGLAFAFIPPVHIYRQLRGAYALSWFSALWRMLVLVFFACFAALSLFLLLLLALGVMH
ncbi:MAG TPA: DUF3667 domain-containing protein [Allosphingosinicella sp.]|jgi:hypothetical protein|nr:DUF3667 domain-containing protein [Allosphingosinicella sp.]